MKKVYIIAGESSGDLQVATLIEALQKQTKELQFRARGGENLKAAGVELDAHYKDTAFMGLTDVAMNLRKIKNALKQCQEDIVSFDPDLLLLVDYPGFNLRIAKFANQKGIPVVYFIPPKVWAWRKGRIRSLKQYCSKIFCILPFEKEYYKKEGIDVVYEGNPIFDRIENLNSKPEEGKVVLLPGSRVKEVSRILPGMLDAAAHFSELDFIIAGAGNLDRSVYQEAIDKGVKVEFNRTYELLAKASLAVVASGTATLETALFNVPQVVVYRLDTFSAWIARRVLKLKYVSLVNLIEDKAVVTELLQDDFNTKSLVKEMKALLSGPKKQIQLKQYQVLKSKLGPKGVSDRLAAKLLKILS